MQVYKVFFQILNKQKGFIIMYLSIFLSISLVVSGQAKDSQEKIFEGKQYSFAVFDEDQSAVSKSLVKYLEDNYEKKEIEDDKESIQDALYNRDVACVVRIPKGFGEEVLNGDARGRMDLTVIPGTFYEETFRGMINRYVSMIRSYEQGGFSEEEALKQADEASRQKVTVTMASEGAASQRGMMYYFFLYLPYVMIAICVNAIGTILIIFHRKEVRERNLCSAYSLTKTNMQLFAGAITTMVGLCVIFCLIVIATSGTEIFSVKGGLYCLNMLAFALVSLGLVFFVGQVVKGANALSMCGTVLSLGMSFLCGIFVPLELLGDGLVKAAHFLPAYWYVVAADLADAYQPGDSLEPFLIKLLVQVLFGAAFLSVGLAYSKVKQRA